MIIRDIIKDRNYDMDTVANYFSLMFNEYLNYARKSISLYKMDNYLSGLLQTKTEAVDILSSIIPYISATKLDNKISITIPSIIEYGNYNIEALIKLINNGNLEIKGTKLFDYACEYALNRM